MAYWNKRKLTADDVEMPVDVAPLYYHISEMELFIKYYDEKLQDLMTRDEYDNWSRETALKAYKAMIDNQDSKYRDFIIENFTAITGARYDEVQP